MAITSFKISWEAPEYTHRPKSISWYWASIIIAILMLGLAVWQKNYLFAIFILIAEVLILKWGEKHPQTTYFLLTEKGLTINDTKFYPMSDFKSFSLEKDDVNDSDPDLVDVNIFFIAKIKPSLSLLVPKEEKHNIQGALSLFIPEVDWEPSFLETVERLLGF